MADTDVVEREVRDILTGLGGQTHVLSPLADGADQIVARIALDLGLSVDCPLPLPLSLYEKDFGAPEALHRLIERVRSGGGSVEPIGLLEGLSLEDVSDYGEPRDRMYEAVGRHVVDRSNLLLAIWDGTVNGKRGGTAETIRYALGQTRTPPLRVQVIGVTRQ